jgi:hypothetical protein
LGVSKTTLRLLNKATDPFGPRAMKELLTSTRRDRQRSVDPTFTGLSLGDTQQGQKGQGYQ